jgi:hypothetical protein
MPEGVEVLPPLGGTGGCKLSRRPRDAYRRPGSTRTRNPQQQQGTDWLRCRDSLRRLRLRDAFGVRPLAGAVEERHDAHRPTAPKLLYTNDRTFWRSDALKK